MHSYDINEKESWLQRQRGGGGHEQWGHTPGRSVAAAAWADTCLLIVLLWTAGGGVLQVGRGVF